MINRLLFRLILGTFLVIFSLAFWYFLKQSFVIGDNWLARLWRPASVFLALGSLAGLIFLIESQRRILAAAVALTILPFFAFSGFNAVNTAVASGAFLFSFSGFCQARKEKERRLKIVPSVILKKGLAPFLTGWALLAALLFYWFPSTQLLSRDISLPRPLFDAAMKPLLKIWENTLQDKLGNQAFSFSPAQFFPDWQKELAGGRWPANLPPQTGKMLEGAEKEKEKPLNLEDQLYELANEQLKTFGAPYKRFIPLGVSVGLFFSFKFAALILIWPMIFLSWLIFKLLILLEIVKITKKAAEQETVEI